VGEELGKQYKIISDNPGAFIKDLQGKFEKVVLE
jgi:hypothetical protein